MADRRPSAAAAERKRTAILERLSNRTIKPAASTATASPAFESIDFFLAKFSAAKNSIQSCIDRCLIDPSSKTELDQISTSKNSTQSGVDRCQIDPFLSKGELDQISNSKNSTKSSVDRCQIDPSSSKGELDQISTAISELETFIADSSYFLPSYEVRSALKTVAELRDLLEKATESLLPRKKFSFKNKPSSKKPPNPSPEAPAVDSKPIDYPAGFRDREEQVLVKDFRGEEGEGGEFSLCDLSSCEVYIRGKLRALFIHRLKNCRVFAGPVMSSVLIDGVEGCVLMLASHQVRIHRSIGTDFYLRVRSRPIVEECRGVRFAPFGLRYDGIEEEMRDCGLAEETGNWAMVDDFCWLRAAQSPNWCVLPEEERCGSVDISEFGESGSIGLL
ncbi:C-CAP/cofactor C-like domain-containing protein [Wolffia australiana]